jgi:DNA-binding HxlR family transcriptional regulator
MRDPASTNLPVTMPIREAGSPDRGNVLGASCPSRHALELVANKWTLLIVQALRSGPVRNGALMRKLEGVSQKVLTQALRELERSGLVDRVEHSVRPLRVDYRLTPLGASLSEALIGVDQWVEAHYAELPPRIQSNSP